MKKKNTLLVEGVNDQAFFRRLCEALKLKVEITVATPTDMSPNNFNSKQGVLNCLSIMLPLLEDEDSEMEQLAIVLDADITGQNNGGFKQTIESIKAKTSPHGYNKIHTYVNGGVKIDHSDSGMKPLWIWIMPNNKDDGTIENWIKDIIISSDRALFDQACMSVSALSNKKFSRTSIVKAEIATWLAWQEQPGRTPAYTLRPGKELVDTSHLNFIQLQEWLKEAFL